MIHTAYVRYLGDRPESINTAIAEFGFRELGIKSIPFQGFGDIEESVACGPEALVHGFIEDVFAALRKLKLPIPPSIDYPDELKGYYGREIWTGTLGDIRDRGFVWQGTRGCRLHLAPYPKDTPAYFSTPVHFASEYRCYVLDGEIMAVKPYRGDWSKAPSRVIVEGAVRSYQPYRAYAIDFGVLEESNETVVVEVNDAFALGCYGLQPSLYARIVEARWEELTR